MFELIIAAIVENTLVRVDSFDPIPLETIEQCEAVRDLSIEEKLKDHPAIVMVMHPTCVSDSSDYPTMSTEEVLVNLNKSLR